MNLPLLKFSFEKLNDLKRFISLLIKLDLLYFLKLKYLSRLYKRYTFIKFLVLVNNDGLALLRRVSAISIAIDQNHNLVISRRLGSCLLVT